jgi:hypothetical protein
MSAGEARFISLAETLRPKAVVEEEPAPATLAIEACVETGVPATPYDLTEALRAARLFRATLTDALTAIGARLLRELAADVLARELRIEPANVAGIIRRVLAEYPDEPVRIRVAPCDARVVCDFPAVTDETLQAGDAVIEFVHGNVDARLGVRLADVLATAMT